MLPLAGMEIPAAVEPHSGQIFIDDID